MKFTQKTLFLLAVLCFIVISVSAQQSSPESQPADESSAAPTETGEAPTESESPPDQTASQSPSDDIPSGGTPTPPTSGITIPTNIPTDINTGTSGEPPKASSTPSKPPSGSSPATNSSPTNTSGGSTPKPSNGGATSSGGSNTSGTPSSSSSGGGSSPSPSPSTGGALPLMRGSEVLFGSLVAFVVAALLL